MGLVLGLGGGLNASSFWLLIAGAGLVALFVLMLSGHLSIPLALGLFIAVGIHSGAAAVARARLDCRASWVAGEPVDLVGRALDFIPPGGFGGARFAVEEGECDWTAPLRVYGPGLVEPGSRYRLTGVWQPGVSSPEGPQPPERWGWSVASSLALESRVGGSRTLRLRGALARDLWDLYPERWAPLVLALALGQRETIDPEVADRVARAGLAHLLAISGLHVGLLAAGLLWLARLCRLGWTASRILSTCGVWAFVWLIGAPASASRAALMVLFWMLSRLAGRPVSPFDVLGLSALALLAFNPWYVLDIGFQLSFAGAAAIAFTARLARRAGAEVRAGAAGRLLVFGLAASVVTIAATAPITAERFGRVTPAAIVGNVLAVPLLALAMPAIMTSAALGPVPSLASWPAGAAVLLLSAIDGLAGILSGFEWSSVEVGSFGLVRASVYYALLGLSASALYGAWERARFLRALGAGIAVLMLGPPLAGLLREEALRIHVLDVGQGEAIVIETPDRYWAVVDAGPARGRRDAGRTRVVPHLRRHGARRIEALIITHPDLDHVGGGPAILESLEVESVVSPGVMTGQVGQIALLRALRSGSPRRLYAGLGAFYELDGVSLRFLHPPPGEDAGAEVNAASLVFSLEYGAFRMLFTGDAPGSVERELVRSDSGVMKAQILKVAHHGSASSTSPELLEAVDPEMAVISAGRNNIYGHPAAAVLSRLNAYRIAVRRTDREGTITIEAHRDGRWSARSAVELY